MRRRTGLAALMVKDQFPRDFMGICHYIRRHTTCKWNRHGRKSKQIHKFNGGNTCWLCHYCFLIVRYDSEERN